MYNKGHFRPRHFYPKTGEKTGRKIRETLETVLTNHVVIGFFKICTVIMEV